mgnify:CR=1 FL=1
MPSTQPAGPESARSSPVPGTLRVSALLVGLEALVLIGVGGWLLVGTLVEPPRQVAPAVTSAAFLMIAGFGMVPLAYGIRRARRWARAPVAVVQLLTLPISWQLLEQPTTAGGMTMLIVAVLVLVLTFLPSSTAAFETAAGDDRGDEA